MTRCLEDGERRIPVLAVRSLVPQCQDRRGQVALVGDRMRAKGRPDDPAHRGHRHTVERQGRLHVALLLHRSFGIACVREFASDLVHEQRYPRPAIGPRGDTAGLDQRATLAGLGSARVESRVALDPGEGLGDRVGGELHLPGTRAVLGQPSRDAPRPTRPPEGPTRRGGPCPARAGSRSEGGARRRSLRQQDAAQPVGRPRRGFLSPHDRAGGGASEGSVGGGSS